MSVRLGINPIAWTNDDITWLGEEIPLEVCLAETRLAGYAGVELGGKFPRKADALKAAVEPHGLAVVSGWYSASLLDRDAKAEIAAMADHLALLKAMGCKVMVFAECSRAITGQISTGLSRRPTIDDAQTWKAWGARMTEVARHMLDQGVRMAVHHHMGTPIQSEADIDRMIENTGDEVGLLLDTGHLTFAGGDVLATTERHMNRIVHVHCKDIRKVALEAARALDMSFPRAILSATFTVPGDGIVDYDSFLGLLAKNGYSGWLVNEAEQDPRIFHPLTYSKAGNRKLREICAKVGLTVEG